MALRTPRSRYWLQWNAYACSLVARTGQQAVFSRAAAATPIDATGATYRVVSGQPAWTWIDGVPHLLLGANDRLYFPFENVPRGMMIRVRFVELGSALIDGARVIHIGADDDSAPKFYIAAVSGAGYAATYDPGTPVSASLPAAPLNGDRVELVAQLVDAEAMTVQLAQTIGGVETSAPESDDSEITEAWSGQRLYVNGVGDAHAGVIAVESIEVIPIESSPLIVLGQLVADGDGYSIARNAAAADAYLVADGDGVSISTDPTGARRILMRGKVAEVE